MCPFLLTVGLFVHPSRCRSFGLLEVCLYVDSTIARAYILTLSLCLCLLCDVCARK